MKGFLALFSLFLVSVFAVDKSNFKTCSQSGFCRRNRQLSDFNRRSTYEITPGSIALNENGIIADLLNSANGVTFTFELSFLENNRAHFRINEKAPLRPRYEVKDVIISKPQPAKFQRETTPDGKTTIVFDDNKLILQNSPFRLDFFVKNEPVLSVNSRGLLNFEHIRNRSPLIAEGEENQEEKASELELQRNKEKENGYWEEDFKGHEDRKPNGPTAVALDFTFPGSKGVFGIPEHATSLALKPTKGPGINSDPYRLYNLDVFEYELDVPMALYGAIPYMISHKPGFTSGIFWLNAAETWIDVSTPQGNNNQIDTHWISESGIIDAYIFLGPTPQDVFKQYSSLTGTTALPPLFSIAYHQCRWNYIDEADVEKVDQGFEMNDIPYDVLWLDIEHTDGKKYFTWDSLKFPNPVQMQENLAEKKRKMVTIVDPHIKRDHGYYIHKEATELGLYVKSKEKNDYEGHCWPGSSSWIDFTDPQARDWWASKFSLSNYKSSTLNLYTWNDMNEPSVFNGPEVTMHKHNIHYGGWEHRDVHNVYGFYQHMATAEGLKRRNQQRPFVLSRAFFAGSQRYGAIWTGDNLASWSHLKASLPMLLSLGLAGLPFSGADVGGFFSNPSAELLTRWYQAGAFQPFFRGHAHLDTKRREPWLMGEPYTSHIRDAIRARYSLLPLWYTLYHESSVNGSPIIRPLFVEYPTEESTFAIEDEYLVGNHLLVKPVTDEGAQSLNVYLPGGRDLWYDYNTYKVYSGASTQSVATPLSKIPVFIRGGSVIPKKERVRRSSSLMINDPYTLVIALDSQGQASGDLYIDDGISFDYEKGSYSWKRITVQNGTIKSQDVAAATNYPAPLSIERIVILGLKKAPSKVSNSSGSTVHFEYDSVEESLTIKKPGVLATHNWEISIA